MSSPLPPWLLPAWTQFQSALRSGRLGHALLLAGERGLGKRGLAATMVQRLLCQAPGADGHACGQCRSCVWLAAGTHPDYLALRPEDDSDSIRIHQVRGLIERVQLTGQASSTRVAVIEPADAMNVNAQNALLKTLEEPPPGVHLVLIADEPALLLPTVRSRCHAFVVTAPAPQVVHDWLVAQGRDLAPLTVALAAGHPGTALEWSGADAAQRLQAVGEDLVALRQGRCSPLQVAARWAGEPEAHVEAAIAWLRLWSWGSAGHALAAGAPAPPVDLDRLSRSQLEALRLRSRLRTPLRANWLLHEWLAAWQDG